MKNNKGYYSWIHSMKNAAMESHFRGQRILEEEKAKKKAFNKAEFDASMPGAPVQHGKPEVDPRVVRAAAQVLAKEPTTAHSISLAGGDAGAYVDIRRMKHQERLADLAKARGPIDEKPDGDANAVADDAEDGVMADPPMSRLPSYPLAAQARSEHAKQSYKEQNRAARVAARQEASEQDYEAGEEARQEGLEGTIQRIMRGKR